MSTGLKIYTAAEVASVGYSKEQIDEDVAYVTQRAYKAAKYGEKSITHGADKYLLHQIAKRLRELGYTVQLTQEYAGSNHITVWWDNADPTKENKKMSTEIQETINRLRELGQKARPAPWSYLILPVDIHTGAQDSVLLDGDGREFATNAEDAFTRNDFDFILEARNAIPELLAEIERLTAKLTEAWEDGYADAICDVEGTYKIDRAEITATCNPYEEDKK